MFAFYFVLWLLTMTPSGPTWERFDFYFDTHEQCMAAAETMPAYATTCLTDEEDAIMRGSSMKETAEPSTSN